MANNRILILANNSGGLYRFRKDLMIELIGQGYEVYASTPLDDNVNDLKSINVKLIKTRINRRGMNPIKDLGLILKYMKIISTIKPKMIITYTIKPNLYGGLVARLLQVPYCINITGLGLAFQSRGLVNKMVVSWYRIVCKKVHTVFFENVGNCRVFLENRIVTRNRCTVLNGAGVNLEDFPFEKYPEDESLVRFIFIGRIMKEKGVDELFYSIKRLKDEGYNVVLDILGHYEENYESIIQELVRDGYVNFHGYQDDVQSYIKNAHCFVLPSYHEGMANTNLECSAMGRPIITSNIHGCLEAIKNNGFLVNVQDQVDLYIKMKMFVELPYEEKVQMGLNSRKHMEEVFDKRKVVERTISKICNTNGV